MEVLKKFTLQSLKLNKKRTIVTIIGIILSSALICGVLGLISSVQQSLVKMIIQEEGDYHVIFQGVKNEDLRYIENNEKVKSYMITNEIGWAKLEGAKNSNKPYVRVLGYDKKALDGFGVKLLEGRFPQNSDEIIISEEILDSARVEFKMGDKVTFDIGERIVKIDPQTEEISNEEITNKSQKEYTIVGIIERLCYNVEPFDCAGYSVITYSSETAEISNVVVKYNNPKDYKETTKAIQEAINLSKENINFHTELLRYEGAVSESFLKVLYGIGAVIIGIIVVSSVFVIRNSFNISVSEKNRQYGMLSSIGATKKQIRKTVLLEGFFIGLIAIPLGILSGVAAIMILLKVVNYLLGDMLNGFSFIYHLPLIPVLISVVISGITIYLSCLIPSIKASKISPIESIRGNNDIKIKSKKIKTSKIVKKLFGIGGVIASKNLKRSKKKYRTTVISIVISIVIFISLSTFIDTGNKATQVYYTEIGFNMYVSARNEEIYKEIAKLNGVNKYAYLYESSANIDFDKYATDYGKTIIDDEKDETIALLIYDNESFKEYLKDLGLKKEDYKNVAILLDEVVVYHNDETKSIEEIYNIKNNDKITIGINGQDREIQIAKDTDKKPMGNEMVTRERGSIVVSKDFIGDTINQDKYILGEMYLQTDNSTELENTLVDLKTENSKYKEIEITNFDKYVEQENRMVLVIAIFLYGFITVITLIGVTNIFNTITTNMILRGKEFAMLKSIGMTKKEFIKMIRLESIMYGAKALLIGTPIGIMCSYFIYKSFSESIDVGFSLPWKAIGICVISVFLIVGITMKYSLGKINKQNIIEAIRNDNI